MQSGTKKEKEAMADTKKTKKVDEHAKSKAIQDPGVNSATDGFKLNALAPEFVPGSFVQMPISNYYYPYLQFSGDSSGGAMDSNWIYFTDQEMMPCSPVSPGKTPVHNKNTNDVIQKIVKQVEFQFSDANLIASDFLLKIMNKDPEGYVPMSVITSWKKIKALETSNQMIIKALRTSSKLVVSEDGKKVRRKKLFTDRDKEELMSRTVTVENLPENFSSHDIEKLFSTVGSVKNIRICHPQESSSPRSSVSELILSNKLHAFVEFEAAEQAEKAAEQLNDERNWRKGLRVRSLLRRSPRSVLRGKWPEYNQFEASLEEDQSPLSQDTDSPKFEKIDDNQNGLKKVWGRGRSKLQGFQQNHNGRNIPSQVPQGVHQNGHGTSEKCVKPASPGPKNPDGTRGFTMGRGKPMKFAPIKL